MRTHPLSPAVGLEVRDLDLRSTAAAERAPNLRRLLAEHHLLCFRDQALSDAEQVRVAGWFGPTLDESRDGSGATYVSNVRPDGIIREGALLFHSDLAFTSHPLAAITLHAVEVDPEGTVTSFANASRAARVLPAELAARARGRVGVHVFDLRDARGDRRFRSADLPDAPSARHPVLLRHPATGVEVLYVSEMQTDHLEGLEPDAGEHLLAELWAVLYAPDNVHHHRWQPGDFLVWDNLAVQHGRPAPPPDRARTLRRVPIGERGVTLRRS